ncbi:MAG: cystatin-like fold lipoprotein [Clostridia bacterium]|nr:cystatin-like fold lipoprotein [Clostridia bacterium]
MENVVSSYEDTRKYYLNEFEFYDGEDFITFNIVSINFERKAIQVAVTNRGKISVIDYDLLEDSNNEFYFEYGVTFKKIYVKDFTEN